MYCAVAVFVLNIPTLLAPSAGTAMWSRMLRLVGGAASPLFLLALFDAQATDKIASTAKLMEAKYGADPRFRQYVECTPLLIPSLESIGRLF